jgi:glycosyltransferase involved in cell wall biosynthesis
MRFVLLGHADPNDEGFWSGTPMHIVGALRDAGHEVSTIGPLEPGVTLWGRIKGRFYRHAFERNYLINRDPAVCSARAVHANRLLRDHTGADAIIVPYPPDAAYLKCPAPLILVHDATWHQLLDFYPGYEHRNLARETVEGGLELDRLALASCDRAIYASRWAANSAVCDYGIEPSKVQVIPLGAGLTIVPSRDEIARSIEARRHGPTRLLFVGVDWHRKGGDIALKAAHRLRDSGMPVELQIVGCEPIGAAPDFVRHFGFLSKKDPQQAALIHRLFLEANFLIMPSRAECFGVVFCEAAAYGLPVVTTNVGGIPEILADRDWGTMLPPTAPPEEFARVIRTKCADQSGYKRMAWVAREDFEARLNWGAFCRAATKLVAENPRRSR